MPLSALTLNADERSSPWARTARPRLLPTTNASQEKTRRGRNDAVHTQCLPPPRLMAFTIEKMNPAVSNVVATTTTPKARRWVTSAPPLDEPATRDAFIHSQS